MNVRELIDLLESLPEDATVRLAIQPNYPLESSVAGVRLRDGTVYVLEGSGRGYADSSLWSDDDGGEFDDDR